MGMTGSKKIVSERKIIDFGTKIFHLMQKSFSLVNDKKYRRAPESYLAGEILLAHALQHAVISLKRLNERLIPILILLYASRNIQSHKNEGNTPPKFFQ